MKLLHGWLLSFFALSTGCAGAPMSEAKAPPPAPASEAAGPPSPVVSVAPPSERPLVPSSLENGGDTRTAEVRAGADLAAAQHDLEASTGNCLAACRALGSIDRAAGRLCNLASSPEDAHLCQDAKTRLIAARERVRAACGSCPAGPTVDPRAPAPSP
jgi:hypothetical protein